MILISTHNIGFYEDLKNIIFQLSSNTHQVISSSDFIFIIHSSYSKRNLRPEFFYFSFYSPSRPNFLKIEKKKIFFFQFYFFISLRLMPVQYWSSIMFFVFVFCFLFPWILIQLENGPNEFYFYFLFCPPTLTCCEKICKTKKQTKNDGLRHQNETIKHSITSTLFPKYSILIKYAYVKQNYPVDRHKTVLCDFQHSCLLLCAV